MKNTDCLPVYKDEKLELLVPIWKILELVDNLSDDDKADLACTITNMIEDNDKALSVLRMRCRHCGKFMNSEIEVCHCWNDE